MSTIQLKNIKKSYDNKTLAVNDFNLKTEKKEFIIFLGPSGCGKSTTLRMIAGLEDITGGDIYIDSKLINNIHPKDRDIAMVFQNYALYPHMSVYDNIAFSLKMRKTPKNEIKEKVLSAAKTLDLTEYLERKPKSISGGQRQRVALGRAIVRQPKIFLLDEPLSNLDAKLRAKMRESLIKLYRSSEASFVYVTHDQIEAMTMGTLIVVMNKGVVQQIGTPQEIYYCPTNLFVATFIGTPQMNVEHAVLKKSGTEYYLDFMENRIKISADNLINENVEQYVDKEIIFGIRPNSIRITKDGPDDDSSSLPCKVDIVEFMGQENNLFLDYQGKKFVVIAPPNVMPNIGETIRVYFPKNKIHVFDVETEETISNSTTITTIEDLDK